MSRYRPPAPRSSPYITPEGHAKLSEELKHLWKEKRPEVTRRVAEAAALGDRSENADYIYGKRQLAEIDRRIRYLSKRLDELKIVDRTPPNANVVYFGAEVRVERDDGSEFEFRIVGPDEIGDERGSISVDSPMARALVGKRLHDEIRLELDGVATQWQITAIDYRRILPTGA